jgi:hypothetical protein
MSDDEYDAMMADLARQVRAQQLRLGTTAPRPPARTAWYPDSWPVLLVLVLALWPVAVLHGSTAGWVAEAFWLPFICLAAAGCRRRR